MSPRQSISANKGVKDSSLKTVKNQENFYFLDNDQAFKDNNPKKLKRTGSFTDNMSLPVHRWFRYSAGFSAEWVEFLIDEHRIGKDEFVFDPFVGSGTTLIAAQKKGVRAAGAENHPFIYKVANSKLLWNGNEEIFVEKSLKILEEARKKESTPKSVQTGLLQKCYSPQALQRLEAIRDAFLEKCNPNDESSKLIWLAITSILRECSGVGTAQWQYVLPNKTKSKIKDPFSAFTNRIKIFSADMQQMKIYNNHNEINLKLCDARNLSSFGELNEKVKLVVTSPPYPNNYDYADATRLEMTFWGEIEGWGDLQSSVRKYLVRSCSQHAAAEKLLLHELLEDKSISPIKTELARVCNELSEIRMTRAGRKTYHTMIAAYFIDLAKTWNELKPLCAAGADICFVIGDSAPYGIYVPVERWLGDLAIAAGFKSWTFEKIRDRNIKWKNRKHQVPLKEGNLWIKN